MSFGAVEFKPWHRGAGEWVIHCEPHVRARLKRVFPRVPQGPAKFIALSATPENSRELLWFLQRYPMEIAPDLQVQLATRAEEHVVQESRLAALAGGRMEILPFQLAKPPREYQAFAATMLAIRGGLLLGDDVGLGKTVTAICPMAVPANLPAVVVCPAHLPDHWREKLAEFAPLLRVHTLRTGTPYPLTRQKGQRKSDLWDTLPDVILTSYHKLRGWAEVLAEHARYVVFDECQQLRSPGTTIYQAAKYLSHRAPLRMGLSATPIYNYGTEFWPVVDCLIPGALGEYDEFVREWCIAQYGEKSRLADAEQFGAYLRREGILLRRTRKDVGRELPKVEKIIHTVEADGEALDQIKGDAVALARVMLRQYENYRGERMQASGKFEALMRQATGVAKAPYVAEFVRILLEAGEQVVLFGWHREVYAIWAERLAQFNPVHYTGTETAREKAEAKLAFLNGDSRVMFMSLRSGAGVDGLQDVCATVVFGELDWSPGVHEQCIGRVDRDGQKRPVQAYFLTSDEGADPIMIEVLGVKREQVEGVRNPGQGLLERVDTGENNLRRLAAQFLSSRGLVLPPPPAVAQLREPEDVS